MKGQNVFRISKLLLIPTALSMLVSSAAVAANPAGAITGSAPVTVVNTPLPVTGTVNVGNLGATTLPVSVTNFPASQQVNGTVNVGNLPAVQQVSVTNLSSAPVFVSILNPPGSSPFMHAVTSGTPEFAVPATINGLSVLALAVTQVSGSCTGIGSFNIALQDFEGGNLVTKFLFPVGGLQAGVFPMLTQQTQIYFPARHTMVLSDNTPPHGCRLDLSGFYVTD
jgi:hypothetical protein